MDGTCCALLAEPGPAGPSQHGRRAEGVVVGAQRHRKRARSLVLRCARAQISRPRLARAQAGELGARAASRIPAPARLVSVGSRSDDRGKSSTISVKLVFDRSTFRHCQNRIFGRTVLVHLSCD